MVCIRLICYELRDDGNPVEGRCASESCDKGKSHQKFPQDPSMFTLYILIERTKSFSINYQTNRNLFIIE